MKKRIVAAILLVVAVTSAARAAERTKITVKSSLDGTDQPSYLLLPNGFQAAGPPVPLVVSLHSWSGDLEQRNLELEQAAEQRGWICLCPNFRGRNDHPEACGSELAQQDIVDAVRWVQAKYPVDAKRIYLTGSSGGGHMTMLMAGRHPGLWAAASAWVGISDLASWHATHAQDNYGKMLRQSCGGPPGQSEAVDRQYRERSPLTHLARAVNLPLEIAHGVHDGHRGSVPVKHSLDAFNVIARVAGVPEITADEIAQISRPEGRLEKPLAGDEVTDAVYGRAIYLRRLAGPCRISIFEGGHEGIAAAAIHWLEQHHK